jgi:hypothetical protein
VGWSSGSQLMFDIIEKASDIIDDEDVRVQLYAHMIEMFENYDCDTLDECIGEDPAFDQAFNMLYPGQDDEEEY